MEASRAAEAQALAQVAKAEEVSHRLEAEAALARSRAIHQESTIKVGSTGSGT